MAGRFGRSVYRFSSVNRPLAPGGNTSGQDSAQYDGRQYPSAARDSSVEPRARSPPLSPRRESLPASPTYSVKKAASPPSPTPYIGRDRRAITSPPKLVDEYPKYKPTTQPRSPKADKKPVIYKSFEKVTKSDLYPESGKTTSSQKQQQQPNAISIAGENLGAVMEIVQSPKREGGHVIRQKETKGSIFHNDQQNNEPSSKDHKGKEATSSSSSVPASTFLNGNFQSVNNSLLYNASLKHRDPGMHLAFSRNPAGDRSAIEDKKQHSKY